jgi:hypothetical protein
MLVAANRLHRQCGINIAPAKSRLRRRAARGFIMSLQR